MTVSHYLVSGIQVAGLVVGLFGLFYLSLGLFGKTGTSLLLALLPAGAGGIAFGFIGAEIPLAGAGVSLLGGGNPLVFGLLFAVLGFIVMYGQALVAQRSDGLNRRRYSQISLVAFIVIAVLSIVDTLLRPVAGEDVPALALRMVPGVAGGAIGIAMTWLLYATPRLSERRLQSIGFVASTLAALTQFIPPVLDLLNIKQA